MSALQLTPVGGRPSKAISVFSPASPAELNDESTGPSSADKNLIFRCTKLIRSSETSIYRGTLEGYHEREIKAVCKLAVNPRRALLDLFENEVHVYQNQLRDMQGRCIPTFYGFYEGTVDRDRAVCIIMEDCGHSLYAFSRLSDDWLVKLVEILMAIHKRGLKHKDFCPRNVVVDDVDNPTSIRLIDFQYCTPHKCERRLEIGAFEFPPDCEEFNCEELYYAAIKTCLWTPPHINSRGGSMSVFLFNTPEELVELEPKYKKETKTYADAARLAKMDLAEWQTTWRHRVEFIAGDEYLIVNPAM